MLATILFGLDVYNKVEHLGQLAYSFSFNAATLTAWLQPLQIQTLGSSALCAVEEANSVGKSLVVAEALWRLIAVVFVIDAGSAFGWWPCAAVFDSDAEVAVLLCLVFFALSILDHIVGRIVYHVFSGYS